MKKPKQLPTMKCVICRQTFEGYGHNAQPIKEGRCCDACQTVHVLPVRIGMMYRRDK